MLYFTKEKYDCTGCGACKAVCPVDCITLIYDEEGFLYPISDARCIDCGKCERVCPMINKNFVFVKEDFQQYSIVGRHKSDHIWKKSASGGAFTAICELYHEDDGAIFGARFNGTEIVHDYVKDIKDIALFRKSKYVQSDMGDIYHVLKKLLDDNKKVIFSGTPCQVAGIKNYLGRDYDNLLCIDLVCHGVGSPGVFKKYIEFLEMNHGSKVKSFGFRHKKIKMGRMLEYIVVVEFENGKRIENEKDIYNTAFIQALLLRPSCGKCRFANIQRVGDLTIGDFKKKHELLPEAKGLDNFSTIIINSDKGEKAASQLQENMYTYSVEISDIVKTNPPLRQASKLNENRDSLFRDLQKTESVETVLTRYISYPAIYMKIWISLPDRLRAFIKRRIKI